MIDGYADNKLQVFHDSLKVFTEYKSQLVALVYPHPQWSKHP